MLPDSTSALLLLSIILVHSSVLSCRIGTQTECDAAPFVPGHNLLGQSFDIVTLERKRAHVIDVKTYLTARNTCLLCSNPLQNNTLQKLPSSVVDVHGIPQCNPEIQSSFHTSASSLVQAYISQDANDWKAGLEIERFLLDNFDVRGSRSKTYKFFSQKIKEDRYTFSMHSVTCNHYGFILSNTPLLSLEFKQQLGVLPSHYNNSTKNEYRKFIQTYGTHYFRTVNLGGRLRRVTFSRSCLSTMNGLTSNQVHTCSSMGVAVGLGKVKRSSVPKFCINILENHDSATGYSSGLHQHITHVSGGNGWSGEFSIAHNDSIDYMNFLKSLKEQPDVVSYSLQPLYKLIPSKQQQEEMKFAIEHYLEDNALWKLPEEPHCDDMTPNVASNCCPLEASRGTLTVTIFRGWDLYGDVIGPADSYAKMYYGSFEARTKVFDHSNPRWNAEFKLGMVDASLALKIEVWDEDPKYHDLLIQCERHLSPGSHTFTCTGEYGSIVVKYTLTCEPYLTGLKCSRYKPSPLETDD